MRNRNLILDEAEDLFASSDSDPSEEPDDSDEDFIAEDEEPTSELNSYEQDRIDRDVYTSTQLKDLLADDDTLRSIPRSSRKVTDSRKGGSKNAPKVTESASTGDKCGKKKTSVPREIGHSSLPLNSFSITISKIKGDVDPLLLDAVQAVLQPISTKFVLGLEVGIRAFNMHIQGVVSLLMPKTDIYVRELKAVIKQVLPMKGRGFKIQIKPFSVGQTFSSMIGYCTKDQGKGHYQFRVHNVSPSVS